MIGYIGQGLLSAALISALLQACWSFKTLQSQKLVVYAQSLFLGSAFLCLIWAHVTSDFSLVNVVLHSHTAKPLLYKISGVWGNHEGSMLLWVLLLSCFGSLLATQIDRLPLKSKHISLTLMGYMSVGFVGFILLSSDPFQILVESVQEGRDLNPLLQDPSLAIHPPSLYMGYVGCSVPFVLACHALIVKSVTVDWARFVRPWALLAWTFLTLGLGLGSFWAYYELGWGGWWFWDPVENAALMPWLASTALIHSLRVVEKNQALKGWTVFLALLTFALCLLGTFLVRSGMLTSVHSFAVDPERGLMILLLSVLIVGPAFFLFFIRVNSIRAAALTHPLSRSGMVLLNNLFLMAGVATVVLGTFYPLILEAFDRKITVGEPYYTLTFIPIMLPLLLLMGIGPWFSWLKKDDFHKIAPNLLPPFCAAAFSVLVIVLHFKIRSILGVLCGGLAVWIIASTVFGVAQRVRSSLMSPSWSFYGMSLAHLGLGIALIGMVGSTLGHREIVQVLKVGESFPLDNKTIQLKSVTITEGPNYKAQRAALEIMQEGKKVRTLYPEKRFYWTQGVIHGETAIYSSLVSHVYAVLGDQYEGERWSIRIYEKPLINFLWFGIVLMILGGGIAGIRSQKKRNEL